MIYETPRNRAARASNATKSKTDQLKSEHAYAKSGGEQRATCALSIDTTFIAYRSTTEQRAHARAYRLKPGGKVLTSGLQIGANTRNRAQRTASAEAHKPVERRWIGVR